jgi:hypothetical protein
VNYYNAALAATRFAIATKLDDDHLGFLYCHLKYLEAQRGLPNFELDGLPDSRHARHLQRLSDKARRVVPLAELPARLKPGWRDRCEALLSAKKRLQLERDAAVAGGARRGTRRSPRTRSSGCRPAGPGAPRRRPAGPAR